MTHIVAEFSKVEQQQAGTQTQTVLYICFALFGLPGSVSSSFPDSTIGCTIFDMV